MGCLSSKQPTQKSLQPTAKHSFEKDIAQYNEKIEKTTAIIGAIDQRLRMKPDEQKKKTLLQQLAHARIMLKFNATRTLLIKEQANLATNRQNMKYLELIKKSNENYASSETAVLELGTELQKYKTNNQNMEFLEKLKQDIAGFNKEGVNLDAQMAKLEQQYRQFINSITYDERIYFELIYDYNMKYPEKQGKENLPKHIICLFSALNKQ